MFDMSINQSPDDLEFLLGSLFDDPDFSTIHRRMSPFNIFEAVGSTRAELRHSNFLAYLLSPSRPHGLGARVLQAVIRSILKRLPAGERPILSLELIANDLDDAIVYRERDNIDILVELPSLNFVMALENKIGSKAGPGQLARYDQQLRASYPSHRRLLVFLTPDSTDPDHHGYVPYDYADLAVTLDGLISDESEPIPTETALIIRHYNAMVRRHIVPDERLQSLAVTLYERHKEAFDYIFECRPEPNSLLSVARNCAESVDGLTADSSGANIFRFFPNTWDVDLKSIKGGPSKWSKTGRGLLFEIKTYSNAPGRVNVSLVLGPIEGDFRAKIYEMASKKPDVFRGIVKPMGEKWATIFSRDLLTANQAKGMSFDAQASNVGLAWSDFQSTNLPILISEIVEIDNAIYRET